VAIVGDDNESVAPTEMDADGELVIKRRSRRR
jgi:hypothetical protein